MTEERIEGVLEEGRGMAREAWGEVTGQEELRTRGRLEQVRGQTMHVVADIKDSISRSVDQVRRDPSLRVPQTRKAALTLLGYLAMVLFVLKVLTRGARMRS